MRLFVGVGYIFLDDSVLYKLLWFHLGSKVSHVYYSVKVALKMVNHVITMYSLFTYCLLWLLWTDKWYKSDAFFVTMCVASLWKANIDDIFFYVADDEVFEEFFEANEFSSQMDFFCRRRWRFQEMQRGRLSSRGLHVCSSRGSYCCMRLQVPELCPLCGRFQICSASHEIWWHASFCAPWNLKPVPCWCFASTTRGRTRLELLVDQSCQKQLTVWGSVLFFKYKVQKSLRRRSRKIWVKFSISLKFKKTINKVFGRAPSF